MKIIIKITPLKEDKKRVIEYFTEKCLDLKSIGEIDTFNVSIEEEKSSPK